MASTQNEDVGAVCAVVVLVIWAVLMVAMVAGDRRCRRSGGAYVRTATWFACVPTAAAR